MSKDRQEESGMALKDYVLEQKEYLTSMRQYFHAHPEVSLQEYHTCERIEKELDLAGIPHRRVGETGDRRKKRDRRSEKGVPHHGFESRY